MKKKVLFALTAGVFAISSLSGCSSEPKKEAKKPQAVYDCVFPNTNQPAPGWICDEPVPGIEVSAVGIAEPSKAGLSFMKDMAAADARARLAEQLRVRVQKMVKSYLGSTGVAEAEVIDRAASSTIKTITNETLVGSKVLKSRVGPNGKLYVLVGLDKNAVEKITQQAVKTSMNNDQALWQQFKAKQSFDEMAAEIAKQAAQ
jgi:hypothetical protein